MGLFKTNRVNNEALLNELEKISKDIDVYILACDGTYAVVGAFDPEKSRVYPTTDLGPSLEELNLNVSGFIWDTLPAFKVSLKAAKKKKNGKE